MMRKDITIEPEKGSTRTGELTAFRIAYMAPDSHIAQQIVNELTSLLLTTTFALATNSHPVQRSSWRTSSRKRGNTWTKRSSACANTKCNTSANCPSSNKATCKS